MKKRGRRASRRRTLRGGWWWRRRVQQAPPLGLDFEPLTAWQRFRGLQPKVRLPQNITELMHENEEDTEDEERRKKERFNEIIEYLVANYPEEMRQLEERSRARAAIQGKIIGEMYDGSLR